MQAREWRCGESSSGDVINVVPATLGLYSTLYRSIHADTRGLTQGSFIRRHLDSSR